VTPVTEKEPPAEGRLASTLAAQDGRLASMRYIPTLDDDNTRRGFIDHEAFAARRENRPEIPTANWPGASQEVSSEYAPCGCHLRWR
jgi:hypothetical protein